MKIKLSKSQWEKIGKKAGWIKNAQMTQVNIQQEIHSLKKELLPNLQIALNKNNIEDALLYAKDIVDYLEAINRIQVSLKQE